MTDAASIAEASRAIERDLERLDVLVNNAGIILGRPKPSETQLDDVRRVFEVNVFAAVAVTNAMLPLLRRASPAARIVMVSSGIGGLSNHGDPQWKCFVQCHRVPRIQRGAQHGDRAVREGARRNRHLGQRRGPGVHRDRLER